MAEHRQIKTLFFKMKSLNVLNAFPFGGCAKSSKFERVMIVQTHAHGGGKEGFFLFLPQKQ